MAERLTVRTPTLEIAYEASGPSGGLPIILLHGFPDDAHAFDDVAPPLAAAGYRVLVPYLRGYGPTRFLDAATPRMAQQAAIGQDLHRLHGRPRRARGGARRLRLGRPRRVHRGLAGARARPGAGDDRRLQRPEHRGALAPGLRAARAPLLVPVVLQHRARAPGPRAEPARALPAAVAGVVAGLALRRRHVRPHGAVVSTIPTSSPS